MVRIDFISNSSSSSFLIDAESDPDNIIDQKTIEFSEYCEKYLVIDILGRYWYDLDYPISGFIFAPVEWFIERFKMNKQDMLWWHVLKSDRDIANEIVRKQHEYSEKYKNVKIEGKEEWDKYFSDQDEIEKLGSVLLKHIAEAIIPVFKDMKLHYACGSDDSQAHSQWMNDEAYYRDHIWKLNGKFTREYNFH